MSRMPLRGDNRMMSGLSVLVTGLMVALGLLVLSGAAALRHVDLAWRQALASRWTVEIQSPDPAHRPSQADIDRMIAERRTIPGIAEIRALAPDEMRALVRPWLRDPALIAELPLPTLLDVRLTPQTPPETAAIADAIAAKLPGAKLDDHGAWTRDLLRIAQTGEALGLAFFAAIAVTMIVTIAATARARLAVNATEIDLLHTIGATDRYIIRQFQGAATRSAVIGAFAGSIIAAAALVAVMQNGAAIAPFVSQLHLDRFDLAYLAAVPLGAILLAAIVAGTCARSSVRRLP